MSEAAVYSNLLHLSGYGCNLALNWQRIWSVCSYIHWWGNVIKITIHNNRLLIGCIMKDSLMFVASLLWIFDRYIKVSNVCLSHILHSLESYSHDLVPKTDATRINKYFICIGQKHSQFYIVSNTYILIVQKCIKTNTWSEFDFMPLWVNIILCYMDLSFLSTVL